MRIVARPRDLLDVREMLPTGGGAVEQGGPVLVPGETFLVIRTRSVPARQTTHPVPIEGVGVVFHADLDVVVEGVAEGVGVAGEDVTLTAVSGGRC